MSSSTEQTITHQPIGFQGQYPPPGPPAHGYINPYEQVPPVQYQGQPPPGPYGTHPGYGPPPPGQYVVQTGYGPPPPQVYGPPPPQVYAHQPCTQPLIQAPVQVVQVQDLWMTKPNPIPGYPNGLEYLTGIDHLIVKQKVQPAQCGQGGTDGDIVALENKYRILNNLGQQVYFATEESDTCQRSCCGPFRGFTIHVTDNAGQEVIRISREFKCWAGCSWCAGCDACKQEITIEAPVGNVIGYVKQECSSWVPRYVLLDADFNDILRIKGPCCYGGGYCCPDVEFEVFSKDEQHEVGKISKIWTSMFQETRTTADDFGVSFPMDLDVKMKAVMIGAVFLIDFMFYEQKPADSQTRRERRRRRH